MHEPLPERERIAMPTERPRGDVHRDPPAPGDVPNEEEVAAEFLHGGDQPLKEQVPLKDADGDDVRQYTGEPVPTEDGTVIPQQMAVGSQRTVGGGEFPNTPGRADEDAIERGVGDDADGEGITDPMGERRPGG